MFPICEREFGDPGSVIDSSAEEVEFEDFFTLRNSWAGIGD